ncbi:6-pyruvoyl tetrahydropterin synthase family protein [Arthrobacter sp. 2YAF22_2]|uniref:6-pyruvoyl trahydropterin synthase family protein n=1 Tax=Arthrobacter sp. 2YAF22_2 TaxID=3233029 RepID=UPI003F91AEB7
MFSLTVRRNFMIAHSLPRPAFGPAQGLHGATFVTEVTFRRRTLNEDAIVLDIGEAGDVLDAILAELNYKNLDEHPDFAGKLSTTEALAQYIADAVAAKIRGGRDGQALAGIDVTLRETPDAWASYSLEFDAG